MTESQTTEQLSLFKEAFLHSPGIKLIFQTDGLILAASNCAHQLFSKDPAGESILDLLRLTQIPDGSISHFIDDLPYQLTIENLSTNGYSALYIEPLLHDQNPTFWFSTLADFFPDPMWVIDENLKLLNFNNAFSKDVEEFINKPIKRGEYILLPEYDRNYLEFWKSLYERALKGEKVNHEFPREDRTSGDVVLLNLIPIEKQGKIMGVACHTKDITILKRQNKLLEEKSKKLETAFHITSMCEWELDYKSNTLHWIDNAHDYLGITNGSLPSSWKAFLTMIHPEERDGVDQAFKTAMSTSSVDLETRITFNNEDYVWVKIRGEKSKSGENHSNGLIGVLQNINQQKLVELKLAESERRFRGFMNVTPAIIYQYNLTTDTSLYFSKNTEKILGYEMSELLRSKNFWLDKVHPEDASTVFFENENRTADEKYIREYRLRHKKGHWVWVKEYCIDIQEIKNNIIITGIAFDISKEKESAIRLDMALRSSKLGIFEYQPKTDKIITSDVVVQNLGYSSTDELPDTLTELLKIVVHPDDMEIASSSKKQSAELSLGAVQNGYYRLRHKNGNTVYLDFYYTVTDVDENGRANRVIGTLKDITEQKQQQLALAEANEFLKLTIENVPGAVFRYPLSTPDLPDFISEYIETITGYSTYEIYPKGNVKFIEQVHPSDAIQVEKAIHEALKGNGNYEVSYRFKHKKGHEIWLWERGGFLEINEKTYVQGFMTDITDKVRAEDKIIAATLKAEDAERSRISREIHDGVQQTLVSSLFTLQELKGRIKNNIDSKSNALFKGALETLQEGVAETRMIAHSIMPKSIRDFGLIETLDQLFTKLTESSPTHFHFYHNITEDNISDDISTSLYRICQEASNNILKYAGASEVEVQLMKHQDSLILSIDDNGNGFDTNTDDFYFTGLGISSMRSRTNAISGTFDMSSSPGKGTSIIIEVPLTD